MSGNVFFTSDTHLGHANIIRFCQRPFDSLEEMDAELVRRWNAKVGEKDTVYHLGDVSFHKKPEAAKLLWSLNGNIILIAGNHDEKLLKHTWFNSRFLEIHSILERKVNDQRIVFCHYAIEAWNKQHYGSWHVHGHSHGSLKSFGKRLDVGTDCFGYSPASFDEVKALMDAKPIESHDYHQPRDETGKIIGDKSDWTAWMEQQK